MKKLLALLLATLMLLSFVACNTTPGSTSNSDNNTEENNNNSNTTNNNTTNNNNANNNNSNSNESNNNHVSSSDINPNDIVFSSVYSDGVAIINLKDEEGKAYVIDKQGKIIFDFQIADNKSDSSVNYVQFEKGLFIYNGKCYDTKGNVTTPESVGATSFVAFEREKYIIAEKITSTYDTSKKELGVLNTDFEWIVPLKEGYYDLYHSMLTSYRNFFWNEVVLSTDNVKKAITDDYSEKIYFNDGTTLSPADVNAVDLTLYDDNKYILATGESTCYILNTNGNRIFDVLEADIPLNSWDVSFDIRNDFFVIEYDYNPSEEIYHEKHAILYYNLLTQAKTLIEEDNILSSYCESSMTALKEIIFHTNGEIELVYDNMNSENTDYVYTWGIEELSTSKNNQYILVKTRQKTLRNYIDNSDYADTKTMIDVYSVCDRNMNWILKSIPADKVELKDNYLYVYSGWGYIENGYYDLRTGTFSVDKPADFDNISDDDANNNTVSSEEFDFNSITNHLKHTEFVNGKAAVALWNATVSELYITVVDESGNFLFEPVKTDINALPSFGLPFYFDGNYIVLANNTSCGSVHTYNSMTLYTYDATGEKIAEWKASDYLDTWNCSFEYNDGVIVFWLINGEFSDYYRQSRIKYYTYDYKPLFE